MRGTDDAGYAGCDALVLRGPVLDRRDGRKDGVSKRRIKERRMGASAGLSGNEKVKRAERRSISW